MQNQMIGQNVSASIKAGKLTLVIDLTQRLGPSKSGKTERVATTNGNIEVADGIRLGVNAFV